MTTKKTKSQKKIVTVDQIRDIKKVLQYKDLKNCALMKVAGNKSRSGNFRLDN